MTKEKIQHNLELLSNTEVVALIYRALCIYNNEVQGNPPDETLIQVTVEIVNILKTGLILQHPKELPSKQKTLMEAIEEITNEQALKSERDGNSD